MADISCPLCRAVVNVAHPTPGQVFTCPSCGGAFAVSDAAITTSPPLVRDPAITERQPFSPSERPTRLEDGDDIDIGNVSWKWGTTATGLKLLFWTTLLTFVAAEGAAIAMIINPIDPTDLPRGPSPALLIIGGFGCLMGISMLVGFVGMCLCCTAPQPRARTNAIWTIVLMVLALGAGFILGVVAGILAARDANKMGGAARPQDIQAAMGTPILIAMLVQSAFSMAAVVTWFRFHAAVAVEFGDESLRRLSNGVMWIFLVTVPLGIILGSIPPHWLALDPVAKIRVHSAVGVGLHLVNYGSYLLLCRRTIQTINAAQARPSLPA